MENTKKSSKIVKFLKLIRVQTLTNNSVSQTKWSAKFRFVRSLHDFEAPLLPILP